MKEKITKEYQRRQRLILKSKLNGRNKISAINTWVVAIFSYGAGIIQWKASELKDLDRNSKKKKNDDVWRITPEERRR